MIKINLASNRKSLERPSWTSKNLNAYRDRHTVIRGKYVIIKDYYVKSRGLQ